MKKQMISLAFTVLGCCFFIHSGIYGQNVTILGKAFSVVSKTQLNTKTEFYNLKEKSTALAQPYIKVAGVFSKTVFTESEWKAFFLKGTVSSLGKVAVKQLIRGKRTYKFNYVDKGTTKVVFLIFKDSVGFREVLGNLDNLFLAQDSDPGAGGGTDAEKLKLCHDDCENSWNYCQADFVKTDGRCDLDCLDCFDKCDAALSKQPTRIKYNIPIEGLKVKAQ